MKIVLLLSVLILSIVSCTSDDSANNSDSSYLIGSWDGIEEYAYENGDFTPVATYSLERGSDYVVFTENRLTEYRPEYPNGFKSEYQFYREKNEIVAGGIVSTIKIISSTEFIWIFATGNQGTLYRKK